MSSSICRSWGGASAGVVRPRRTSWCATRLEASSYSGSNDKKRARRASSRTGPLSSTPSICVTATCCSASSALMPPPTMCGDEGDSGLMWFTAEASSHSSAAQHFFGASCSSPQAMQETSMTKKKLLNTMISGLMLAAHFGWAAPPKEAVSTAADQQGVAITIYNDNLALVKDARRIRLVRDFNQLAWREVSAQLRPETAQLRNLSNPAGFRLQEQNFDFDLLTPQKLLEKYVGREVSVIRTHPTSGAETRETATVLATNGGLVLKFADRIETGVPGRLAFSGVPDTLRDKPTLVISLVNPTAGPQNLELSYLTGGLSWRADYVAELNPGDDRLDLNGWVTLTNQSGAAYPNARLQLVAGDLNRVRDARPEPRATMAMSARVADAAEMQQESLFEYHLV